MHHHAMRMDNHRPRLLNWHCAQEDTINTKTRTKTKMGDQMGDPNGLSPKGPGPTDGLPDLLKYNKERKRGRSFEGNMALKANTQKKKMFPKTSQNWRTYPRERTKFPTKRIGPPAILH